MLNSPDSSQASATGAPFSSLDLSPDLLEVVAELGYTAMTPVQEQSLPLLLLGHDLVGQSKTGSGKTAAFVLPILNKIDLSYVTPQALILCPTRELCTQVAREIRKLGRRMGGLQVLILSGGQPGKTQAEALANGVHIVVGTPGRVLDHLKRDQLDLQTVATIVLDEADRMLDMGFEEDMALLMAQAPKMRQTVFFSATYPENLAALSHDYQLAPSRVTIEETEVEEQKIEQSVWVVEAHDKIGAVLYALREYEPRSAIIFCNMKAFVSEVAERLEQQGVSQASLHGDLEQLDRDRVLAKFRNGSTRVLVATDVAARGLDIEDLDLVINFDLPHQPEVYVHRIGRTGRAGKHGRAISLIGSRETSRLLEIERYTNFQLHRRVLSQKDVAFGMGGGAAREAAMQTLFIAGGRKDKVRPGDILGALTGEAGGLASSSVGKIEIHDRFAYVAVSSSVAETALTRLRAGRIKGRKFQVRFIE